MKQTGMQAFKSEDGKFTILCDNDSNLGNLHDFLLSVKGHVIDLITAAQKQEREASEKVKEVDAKKAKELDKAKAMVEKVEELKPSVEAVLDGSVEPKTVPIETK